MKHYSLVNNLMGWLAFVVEAVHSPLFGDALAVLAQLSLQAVQREARKASTLTF